MATEAATCPDFETLAPQMRYSGQNSHSAYLVGMCGSGMKALAELLSGMGWEVSGSDNNASDDTAVALAGRGLRIHSGHDRHYLPKETGVLVYSPAVGPENAERQQ